jgi:hypothetical protein
MKVMKCLRALVAAAILLPLGAAACNQLGEDCTDIGCASGVMFDILPEDGEWQPGAYALAVTLDADAYACEFQLPDDLPANIARSIECGALTVTLAQRMSCMEVSSGNSAELSCTPNPGEYDLLLSAYGTPAESTLTLSRDGEEILSDARTINYEQTFPNGESCEPGCSQARVVLEP